MKNYIINSKTMILRPINKVKTEVFEKNNKFIVEKNILYIIRKSCEYYGSTYLGRHEASKILLKKYYKSPIIVEEGNNIIFFPTKSPRLEDCMWISLNNVDNYQKSNKNTIIYLKNNEKINLNISYYSFNNIYFNALKLQHILLMRKK